MQTLHKISLHKRVFIVTHKLTQQLHFGDDYVVIGALYNSIYKQQCEKTQVTNSATWYQITMTSYIRHIVRYNTQWS